MKTKLTRRDVLKAGTALTAVSLFAEPICAAAPPAEAVTPEQAMRMVTIDAAYTLGVEDMVGSIEPGKWADFAVLGDDPLTVPKLGIKNVPVVATVLGGRVIPVSSTKAPRPL